MIGGVEAEVIRESRSEEDKRISCRELLSGAGKVVDGTPAHAYLTSRCGDPGTQPDLRAHPGIRHSISGGCHPALLGIMRRADGSGASVHRTFLTESGKKAIVSPVRMMMPGSINGASIRLGGIAELIGLAEGIETALCASKLFGIPVWAATSAGSIKTWEAPEGVKGLVIFADNDLNFTGQEAAYALAKKLSKLSVEIKIPDMPGTDWADHTQQEQ